MDLTPKVNELIEKVAKDFPNFDIALLQRAYDVAAEAHKHQKRKTGEPYVSHCLETASILADLRMDPPVIMAGLLHDTVEDTTLELKDIRRDFGDDVTKLVNGVTKLSKITQVTGSRKRSLGHMEAESLRKMLLAMGEDVRVVLVKLADRLHNMRTLHALPRRKQIGIAKETRDLFAPLANRLGIWQIKWELEDLCLRYLEPDVYLSLVEQLNERREERANLVNEVCETVRKALLEVNIEAKLSGRAKHLNSIYKKMKRKERDLDQIFDMRAVRVIVNTKAECYAALGIVHGLWRPISQEFDDYIANPKENNYQSLHTAVYGPGGKTLEVQIRTQEMHIFAEYGVAAHWLYKEQKNKSNYDPRMEQQIRVLRQMMEMGRDEDEHSDAESFVDKVRSDVLLDRVFVFTPKGEIRELPAGATPLDFAYYIHTEVGHRCRGAKVNGKIVPLAYQLKDGDQVHVLTAKRGAPSRDWLNPYVGYVNTARAKAKIRAWFRKQDREENIRQGRDMMERELRQLGLKISLTELAENNNFDKVDDFFSQIGAGDLSPHRIAVKELEISRAKEAPRGIEAEIEAFQEKVSLVPKKESPSDSGVIVRGVGSLVTRMSRCCNPVPGEAIIGYVTRGHGVSVHRRACPNMLNRVDRERILELDWGAPENRFSVTLKILALDRDGLLRDIVDVVANEKVNIASVTAVTDKSDHSAIITATVEVCDVKQLSRILSRINNLPNVVEAHRAVN